METLRSFGYQFIEPGEGYLACGYVGKGRLEEPETIVEHLNRYFNERKLQQQPLKGKKYLITAGPTREAIDPVRFVTNHSSGKMGSAPSRKRQLKWELEVTLITGPVNLTPPPKARVIPVESADRYV